MTDDLAESIGEFEKKKSAYDTAKKKSTFARVALQKKKTQQQGLAEKLQSLVSAGESEVQNAKWILQDAEKRKKDLEAIQDGISSVNRLILEESNLAGELKSAQDAEAVAESEYHHLYTAFREGQAGIFAKDLRKKLETETEVVCPVCGTVHTSADESLFAPWHKDIPTSEAVDEAYNSLDVARKSKQNVAEKYSKKASEHQSMQSALLEKTEELIRVSDWEVLVDGEILAKEINVCTMAVAEAQKRYDQAVTDKIAKEEAVTQKGLVDQDVEKASTALESAIKLESTASMDAATAERSMKNWKAQLTGYPETKKEAEKQISLLTNQITQLQQQINAAKEDCTQCTTDQAKNKGNLESANNEKVNRKQAKENATAVFISQLEKYSFADEIVYHAALSPGGVLLEEDAISAWITEKQAELDDYDQTCRDLRSAINQLTESTRGMMRIDITELQAHITKIAEDLGLQKKKKEDLASDVGRNQDVQRELKKIQIQREKLGKASAKLNPLANTADGKYAFSRYVLTGFFHRIVEQANVHLETMTDGEYCLIPKEIGDGRSNIGLELKVMNTITTLERDTGSLSGGQLFEASLSLALGLSDVVQMESASSIQIDSMFIDEGFGSLDGGRLDKAIKVLEHLSAGKRQIGIISHVSRLDESLHKKIHVVIGDRGSTVRVETDV